jgi:DNA adenine methylase
MEYLTTAECAKKWNISQRRVAIYCKEGRIAGAVLKGSIWLIPWDTQKPQDPRKVRKMVQEK